MCVYNFEQMRFNNSGRLHFCIVFIIISMFLCLPTMLVLGQNEATHSVTLDREGNSTTGDLILESSRVEYDSSGWTNFTVDLLNATYQEDGEAKDYSTTLIFLNVYSGSSEDKIDSLSNSIALHADKFVLSLENESTVSLVFSTLNVAQTYDSIELNYTIEGMGVSVGVPNTVAQGSLPLSPIAIITAIAALGTMLVLISLRRMKLKR